METKNKKYEEKIVQISRVTKVVKGGKKLKFRVTLVLGDKINKIGVGIGKADNVNLATKKAISIGKKNLLNISITPTFSILNSVYASYGSAKILLKPAPLGTGIIAGSSIKSVLELSGLKNIISKQLGSSNIINNTKATILALIYLNEKIKSGREQSFRKKIFYNKNIKKY